MLTGHVPYAGTNTVEVLTKHVRGPVPQLRVHARNVPTVLDPIIEKLLAKQPDRRHQSADDLITDLQAVLPIAREATSENETRLIPPPGSP